MSLEIFFVTIITMVASLLFFPKLKFKKFEIDTYWFIVIIGALILILSNSINKSELLNSLTKNQGLNPIKLIILFLSMTILSVFLDEIGFFKWLSIWIIKRIKGSQIKLYLVIYALVSILTIFTSNDVIILTFTPLIAYVAKASKIKPLPYLFAILTAANTWSIMLIIGNPTNIYLAVNQGIDFLTYLKIMFIPGLVAGISGLIMVFLIFRKDLKEPINISVEYMKLTEKFLVIIGSLFIILTIILLAISNFINLEMWLICLTMAILLTLIATIYILFKKKNFKIVINTYTKTPWSFIPLIIGMYVLLEGIKQSNYLYNLTSLLNKTNPIFSYGVTSFLIGNVMNNQPMSMMYSIVLESTPIHYVYQATYASIVGSNLGVLFTPLGALAGLMWMNLLEKQGIELSFLEYIKKIFLVGLVTLILTLLTLNMII